MVRFKKFEVKKKFFFWYIFIHILLFFFSIIQLNSFLDITTSWFLFVLPFFSFFFYTIIAHFYHVVRRGWFFTIPSSILIYIIQMDYFFRVMNLNGSSSQIFLPYTVSDIFSLAFFVFIFFMTSIVGGILYGFPIALIITKPKKPNDDEILNKSISFKLSHLNEKENIALVKLLIRVLEKYLHYAVHRAKGKNCLILTSTKSFSISYIFIYFDNENIVLFPFIKDGYCYESNERELPFIKALGYNIFNLDIRTDEERRKDKTTRDMLEKFEIYTQPHKILTMLKSLKDLKFSRYELYCIGMIVLFFIILGLIYLLPNIISNISIDLLVVSVIVTTISIIVGLATLILSYLKSKNDKKNKK